MQKRIFSAFPILRRITVGDVAAYLAVAAVLYVGVRLALSAPAVIRGPHIELSPRALPIYALLSLCRMIGAYALSLVFTIFYGYQAARNRRAEKILLPLLDVLQSVPILSFLPVVLLGLSAVLPVSVSAEIASIVLIFTSQAWNLTFAWYQSLTTVPKELREASTVFGLNGWMRFRLLELPFSMISLLWNSMMSWAGGWFFLMAAEIFTVANRDFRLPGLGAYLQEAASRGDLRAIWMGVATLVIMVVALDQFVWRPLLAWAERFKLSITEDEQIAESWVYDAWQNSSFGDWVREHVIRRVLDGLDAFFLRRTPSRTAPPEETHRRPWLLGIGGTILGIALVFGAGAALRMLIVVPASDWGAIAMGLGATFLRVLIALTIAVCWTVPVGVAIGTSPKLAGWVQPILQVLASVPATALFPVVLLFLIHFAGGLNLAAILLMLLGTQWYLLFNIVAGATAIPQELKYTASLLQLEQRAKWRVLTLPALFPYAITGAITASGGAWNASIVAEYTVFGGKVISVRGVGSLIAQATATGNYPLLLAATLSMVFAVVVINRAVWRPLYDMAESRYRLE